MTRRPPALKDSTVKIRISPQQLKAWQLAAWADGMDLSTWIRNRCDGKPASAPAVSK